MNSPPSFVSVFDRRSANPSVVALVHSLALLALVVVMALVGLAIANNWPKMLRVGLAFGAYASILVAGVAFRPRDETVPYWLFAAAGAAAGLMSGLVRPVINVPVALVSVLLGAFLLGTVHWAGARRYELILRGDHLIGKQSS